MLKTTSADRASRYGFFGACAALFLVCSAMTMAWDGAMPAMAHIPVCGGAMMAMAWMRMPDQTWLDAAASFLGMWVVMMPAMMLPALAPSLWRYRQAIARDGIVLGRTTTSVVRLPAATNELGRTGPGHHPNQLAILAALGYFTVWFALGIVIYPLGATAATMRMELPALADATPIAAALLVLAAGVLQSSKWKARHLACCRHGPMLAPALSADTTAACTFGLRLGLHCIYSCASLTMVLLALGVMDLYAMVAVTAAITIERLAPAGERSARMIGIAIIALGLFLMAQALGLSPMA